MTVCASVSSTSRERARFTAALKRTTFGAFPAKPPPFDIQIEHDFDEDAARHRFGFTSEEGWRQHGQLLFRKPLATPAPAIVALRSPGEGRWDTRSFLLRINAPWLRVAFEPRGIRDTARGEDLNWHLRRAAAWTGCTIASMRVWDTLRELQAVRQLPEVDARQIALAAHGELCAAALYAALLKGHVRTVFLEEPLATQNAASEKDGRGPAIEMLGCLRISDLAQVAGVLWPTELVSIGNTPPTGDWAETLYRQLGAPGRGTRVADVATWRPV